MPRRPPARGPGFTGPAAASIALHAAVLGVVAGLVGWFGGAGSARDAMVISVGAPQLSAPAPHTEPEPEVQPCEAPAGDGEPQVLPVAEEFPVAEFEAVVLADEPPAWLQAPPRERREAAEQKGEDAQPLNPPEAGQPLKPPEAATAAAIVHETCPTPEYPRLARRRGLEGTVWLRLSVTPEGLPAEVILETSSGHSLLDESALAAARGWQLIPATRDGVAVEGMLRVPVTFRLDGGR